MNPPAEPIRTELNKALVGGIRQRGAEAVGLVLVGTARLFLAFLALLFTQVLCLTVFGYSLASIPLAWIAAGSAGISLLAAPSMRRLRTKR